MRLGPLPRRGGPDGFRLDQLLGGGLRCGAMHEVVPQTAHDEAAASGFALGLAARCLGERKILVWIVQDRVLGESGAPYRPGLQTHGIDADRLVVVRTGEAQSTLWAMEEALRTRGVVVLAELWGGRQYGLAPSRRLVLAARGSGGIGLLLHAGLPGSAVLSSGSETRFTVTAHPTVRKPTLAGRLPVPGHAAFLVRLDKLRSPPCDFDPAQSIPVLWNAEQRCFHDHELSVAVAAPSTNRPAQAHRRVG